MFPATLTTVDRRKPTLDDSRCVLPAFVGPRSLARPMRVYAPLPHQGTSAMTEPWVAVADGQTPDGHRP